MNRWPALRPRSLHLQTLLVSLGPAVMIALLLGSYLIHSQIQDLERELEQSGQLIASQLAPAAEYGVLTGNRQLLHELVNGSLQRAPNLYSIDILDTDGQLLATGQQPATSRNLTPPFSAQIYRERVELDAQLLDSSSDLSVSTQPLGSLQVRMSRAALEQRQRQVVVNATLFALAALLVTGLIAYGLAHSLSRPIIAMGRALRRMEDGNYQTMLERKGPGELGELADHINQLAKVLEEAGQLQQRHIEELTAARIEAEQANQAKSSFLAMMSHELRTPLNGVYGMLQLLATSPQSTEQQEHTRLAMESTDHLLSVINDILDLSRIERGLLQLEQIAFQPHELIERTVQAFRPAAEEKQLSLSLQQPDSLASIETIGDPTRLRQILVNLIGNAIKFTSCGEVQVSVNITRQDHECLWLQLRVRDTGIGIEPQQLQRMFQAFEQADSTTSRRFGGTGLGLTIASDLAGRMGGCLDGSSRPGEGSEFCLELPLPWRRSIDRQGAVPHRAYSAEEQQLLLVEEDAVNRFVIEAMLEQQGYQVVLALNGIEALELLESQPFDALLLDCQPGGIDGLEMTRRIRAGRGPNRDTPIIGLIANATPGSRHAGLQAGMNDCLGKPLRQSELQGCLQHWLQTRP